MPIEHIVVDGSNIATEGRSLPSLKQLEEAVAELRRDHPDAEITVIVDATFAHRIDPSELGRFEEAALRGEYVHPPAGAIGRGDAFLLRVAEKVDATVLSNDSFQEFHGEHPWLFDRGRLLGATPVPGIGWIFSPRQPVRGPRSHQAVRETEQARKRVTKAIAVATKEVVRPSVKPAGPSASAGSSRRRSRGAGTAPTPASGARDAAKATPLALNDPLAFISFIAEHRLGERLEGEVEGYTSHGAVVRVGEMRCYVPLANLGDPPPRSAREVLKRNEHREFVLTALDPQRRGAELALPGIALVSGHPREETVAAEVRLAKPPRQRAEATAKAARPAKKVAGSRSGSKAAGPGKVAAEAKKATRAAAAKSVAKKASAAKAPAAKQPAAKQSPAKQPAAKQPAAAKVAAKQVAGKQPAAKKAARAVPSRAAAVTPAAKTSAAKTPGRAPAKKTAAKTAPATKAPARKAPARKAPAEKVAAGEKTAAKRQATSSTPAKAQPAGRKSPAKKAAIESASAPKAPRRAAPSGKRAGSSQSRRVGQPQGESAGAPAKSPAPVAKARRSPLTTGRAR
jgi:hypothetical protein